MKKMLVFLCFFGLSNLSHAANDPEASTSLKEFVSAQLPDIQSKIEQENNGLLDITLSEKTLECLGHFSETGVVGSCTLIGGTSDATTFLVIVDVIEKNKKTETSFRLTILGQD